VIRYVAWRVPQGILVAAGVVILTFVIARVIPGDPAVSWVGAHASRQELHQARVTLGLDRPLPVQVWRYFRGILSGDWGTSIHTHQPVLADIGTRLPASLELVGAAVALALLVGIPLGLLSARWEGRAPDFVVRLFAVVAVSMPLFWLALIFQLVFFQHLGLLPVAGIYNQNLVYTSPLHEYTHMPVLDALVTGNWPVFTSALSHLVLPAIVVALYPLGVIARMVRASVLDSIKEDYITMVRSLGFSDRAVLTRYALKPSLNPIISVTALVFAYGLANTFLVESIFDWPGLGAYAADSIHTLDTPSIVGITLIVALVYVMSNLAVDLVQAAIDPRIRLS
jgi:peptide/nickel transport system permease protein